MKRNRLLISMLVALTMIFSIVSLYAAPVQGNIIVDSQFADPESMVPGWGTDTSTTDLGRFLFTPLIDFDEKYNLKPGAAESWTVSPDKLTYTLKLRKDLKWHDGAEVTAEDVKFTYDMIMSSESNAKRRSDVLDSKLKSVTVKDKYTVVFQLSGKNMWFEYTLTNNYWLPKHILGKVAPKDIASNNYFRKPVGNGPFKFVEYITSERIVFEPFAGYPADMKPKTPSTRYIYQIVPSQPTALLKVQTGEANLTFVPPADIPAMKKISDLSIQDFPDATIMYLALNQKRPFFEDKRTRQAIAYAINKEALSKGVYKGYYKPASAYYPSMHWFHNPNVKKYDYNISKAKQLLDEAGWKVGRDGIREKNGVKFKFTLLALKGNVGREKTCVFIQSSLRQLGIQVEVRSLEWVTLNTKYLDLKNFDAAYVALSQDFYPEPGSSFGRDGTFNYGSFYNAEVETLIQKVNNAEDRQQVKDALFRIQEIVQEELPVIVLLYPSNTYAMAKGVKDVNFVYGNYFHPADWHVDSKR